MKQYIILQILLIALISMASLSLGAQKSQKYTLKVYSDSITITHEGILTQLKDSGITIGTSYKKVNKQLLFESYEEVSILKIESLSFDKMGSKGATIGVISGLVIGTTLGLLHEVETGTHSQLGFNSGISSNKQNKVFRDAVLGMLGGGILGYIIDEILKKPIFFEINKNHKKYMDNKEHLEKYAFKY